MMIFDKSGKQLNEDDVVILLVVSDDLVRGLPEQEAIFLRSAAGTEVTVSEVFDEEIEVTLTDETEGITHYLRVSGQDLLKIDRP
jgi:hypothetical protein